MSSELQGSLTRGYNALVVGNAPTALAVSALLIVGTMAMMITGVQSLVLGAIVEEHRLSLPQLGWATAAELLAIGLAETVVGAVLKPHRLRTIGIAAGLLVVLADLAGTECSGLAMVADRAVAGLAEGILLWLPVSMIARARRPALWWSVFQIAQAVAQLAFALIVPVAILDRFGANGAIVALALTGLIAMAAALFIPTHFEELPTAHSNASVAGARGGIPLAGYVILGAMFLLAAFTFGVYAYFEPLGAQAGHSTQIVGFGMSASLAGQILGVLIATLVVNRLRAFPVLIASAAANFALLALFASMPGAWIFVATGFLYGLVFLFTLPFMIPMVIEVDPSRRSAVVLNGVLLVGASVGPAMCAFAVHDSDARGAVMVSGICLAASTAILVAVHFRSARVSPAAG
jgi:hypothetical protein